LVVHSGDGYSLSEQGKALLLLLLPVVDWANQWVPGSK
jgi:DNA-binding HxlR family transcriptional regulator